MPLAVSKTRGYGLPRRGALVTVFSTKAPSLWTSRTRSMIPPDVPEATIIGLESVSGPSLVDRSAVMKDPDESEGGDAAAQHRIRQVEVGNPGHEQEVPDGPEEEAV